jgi:dGTPase
VCPLYKPEDYKRVVEIDDDPCVAYCNPFRRDYARLVHSPAFRRLQGKMQLFPVNESDYSRNRLTHSIEVAQIAKSIAIKINNTDPNFSVEDMKIDTDLIETIALAHDLGHPPFGHNGEEALNECMADYGGFEGNSQTLRILSRLEKRDTITKAESSGQHKPILNGQDNRAGLNLTFRTLAGILKYDSKSAEKSDNRINKEGPSKGYFFTEDPIVTQIKEHVGFDRSKTNYFKTLECSIMDIADDIAYSTYDLDDCFKAGFLNPVSMFSNYEHILEKIVSTVRSRMDKFFYNNVNPREKEFSEEHVYVVLKQVFPSIFASNGSSDPIIATSQAVYSSNLIANNGYLRHEHTSSFVSKFIDGVEVEFDKEQPWLSRARLRIEVFKQVEALKNFTFYAMIMSPRMRVVAHRGREIITDIFNALARGRGEQLMPEDFRALYEGMIDKSPIQRRIICDFIAGMTDRYATQFYGRLTSTDPESIYSPI